MVLPCATSLAYCCFSKSSEAAAANPKQRKKKRKKGSISRHAHGSNKKLSRSTTTTSESESDAALTPTITQEPPSTPQDTYVINKAARVIAKLKSLRNKRDYQRRKVERTQEQLAESKDKLNDANDQIADLHHTNHRNLLLAQQHQAAAEKSSNLLATRTDRFIVFRAKTEEEIKRVKAVAARRVAVLEKNHQMELLRAEARMYRLHRENVKQSVMYESKLVSLQKANQ